MKRSGAVTASSSAAAEAGVAILRQGGNAVDAAVATALASCVADGCNTGLGGYGGHMVVGPVWGDPVSIDFNMWVPASAADAYRGRGGEGPPASVIPNVIAGLSNALGELGTMDWATVSAPAVELAAHGVEANATIRAAFNQVACAGFVADCFAFEPLPDDGGEPRFRFKQAALARTLEQLATNGPAWFYDGPIGDLAVRILRDGGHELTRAHWSQAPGAVTVAPAPRLRIGDATLFSAPLGTSGSASMFATVSAGAALACKKPLDTAEAVLAWATKIASAWTYRFGTQEGNCIAADGLQDWIARAIAFEQPATIPASTGHTCHLNTCDGDGMIVAMTLTHGPAWFGARWAVSGSGVIMNAGAHLLADVAPRIAGARAFAVTNMSPTIARTKDGGMLAVGCPGGRRIPTIIGLFLTRHLFGGIGLQDAVSCGRFHAESRDLATVETGRWDPSVPAALRTGFRAVAEEGPEHYYGPFTSIQRESSGGITFGLDDRWLGCSALCPELPSDSGAAAF